MANKQNKASSKKIFKHLCEQMDKLDKGEIDVNRAKAQANLARQANNTLRYELDRAVTMAKYGGYLREVEED